MFWVAGNYLRVRGEYINVLPDTFKAVELPPRARRIQAAEKNLESVRGTTSACAENTTAWRTTADCSRNYLRVRGEYNRKRQRCSQNLELPPRARRIHAGEYAAQGLLGTTSACAENTNRPSQLARRGWNYLRVRGEYAQQDAKQRRARELPPRARRIRNLTITMLTIPGTTSACAENTAILSKVADIFGNYLRVRGEY